MTSSTAGTEYVTIPYTGNGYVIAFMIWVEGGAYNPANDWYNAISQYAIGLFSAVRCDTTSAQDDAASVWSVYKSSSSSATTYSRSANMNTSTFSGTTGESAVLAVKMPNRVTLAYRTKGSTYGLMPETAYHYIVIYSE